MLVFLSSCFRWLQSFNIAHYALWRTPKQCICGLENQYECYLLLRQFIFCYQDNLNTDGIYPGKYTYNEAITPEEVYRYSFNFYVVDWVDFYIKYQCACSFLICIYCCFRYQQANVVMENYDKNFNSGMLRFNNTKGIKNKLFLLQVVHRHDIIGKQFYFKIGINDNLFTH